MAKKRHERVTVKYPKHAFSPEELLHFIEMPAFTAAWKQLGLDDEDDLLALQLIIMASPKAAPIVRGTGGLRKLRFAPIYWNVGARDAARVCYVYFEEFGIVLLVLVYGKNEQDDLPESAKKQVRKLIREIQRHLERRKTL